MKKLGFERLNSSRGASRLPCSRRFKPQRLGVASNEACLLKVRSFPAHAPNVVATTFRETNSLRRAMQVVESGSLHRRARGRVSSQPRTRPAFGKIFHTPCVRVRTHYSKFLETYINQGKYSPSNPNIHELCAHVLKQSNNEPIINKPEVTLQ